MNVYKQLTAQALDDEVIFILIRRVDTEQALIKADELDFLPISRRLISYTWNTLLSMKNKDLLLHKQLYNF